MNLPAAAAALEIEGNYGEVNKTSDFATTWRYLLIIIRAVNVFADMTIKIVFIWGPAFRL